MKLSDWLMSFADTRSAYVRFSRACRVFNSPTEKMTKQGFWTKKRAPLGALLKLAPRVGLEPTTYRLTAGRSTIELSGKNLFFKTSLSCYIIIVVNLFCFVNLFYFPTIK